MSSGFSLCLDCRQGWSAQQPLDQLKLQAYAQTKRPVTTFTPHGSYSLSLGINPTSTLCVANRQGWSAQQLFDELKLEEFAQTGGLLPMDPRIQAAKDTPAPITAELFAR